MRDFDEQCQTGDEERIVCFLVFSIVSLVNLGAAFAETSGWSWPGESADGLTGRFSGTVNISTDRAVGKYSVKVTTQDDVYDWANYGFFNTFKSVDTDMYSKVSIWVKPGPGAKELRFAIWDDTEGRNKEITSDKNHDRIFKVGEDLESGKWNNLILDLKQINLGGVAKNASNLQVLTNDFSTWYWDEAKVIYAPVANLNISTMPNNYTQLVNGSIRNKLIPNPSYTEIKNWGFNQDGNFLSWSMNGYVNGTVSSGTLNLTSTGVDPYILSPYSLGINATTTKYIKIRMKNNTSSQAAEIFWLTTVDGGWNQAKAISIPIVPNSDYIEYVVDMSSNINWNGSIDQLRFDPGTTTGVYNIDYIIVSQGVSPNSYSTTPTVLSTLTDPKSFPKGRVQKIFINSSYVNINGVTIQPSTVANPNKYLLSFDGRQSWITFKDGKYQKITNNSIPLVSEVQAYSMTSEEVNALEAGDLAQLYQDGQELYSVDVAALFQNTDNAISPQLNGITVTMSGEGVKGLSLQYPKQQVDHNSSNWRTINKIYPIELQPKIADVFYFLSTDGGITLKSYKNGHWNTYQASFLAQPAQNWEVIIQAWMTKDELKAIPPQQLTGLLPANQFSVVYVTEVDDFSTAEYSSKITIDYVENHFAKDNLTLSIVLTSGERLEFTGLTKSEVEDFMVWLDARQYNNGPIFYRLKTPGTDPTVSQNNYFINYYLIQKVEVKELN